MNHCSRKEFDVMFASTGGVTDVWAVEIIGTIYSDVFIIFLLIKDPAIYLRI
jgi:hypothetical protein